jgi:hypothetical protein
MKLDDLPRQAQDKRANEKKTHQKGCVWGVFGFKTQRLLGSVDGILDEQGYSNYGARETTVLEAPFSSYDQVG